MSINIPAETPDESMNPISVEEFERLHPAMMVEAQPAGSSRKLFTNSILGRIQ